MLSQLAILDPTTFQELQIEMPESIHRSTSSLMVALVGVVGVVGVVGKKDEIGGGNLSCSAMAASVGCIGTAP